jgi:hypothetical protein
VQVTLTTSTAKAEINPISADRKRFIL